jgi:pimeloyl-ACP methyl ester carboxylesterase
MKGNMKDVVVLLPGILGSALERDGKTLWDIGAGVVGRALFSVGGSIHSLALSSDGSTGDGVAATRLLPDAHLVPFFWKIDGYGELSRFIQSKVDVVPGENFFEFPYDWRLDNRISAERLATAALGWLENRRRRYPRAQLVFIGHSMGGLVARYFIERLGGWRHTRMLITLGTPHRGSVKALDFLANGLRKRMGPVTLVDFSRVVQSLPSALQLLPIYPCVGESEHSLERLEAIDRDQIGSLNVERARAGIEFHREIERAVEINRKEPDYGYRLLPVVGAFQPTYLSALLTDDGVEPLRTYEGKHLLDGDGTVPRLSATPIELGKAKVETFVSCPHASLQNFDPVRVQMRAAVEDTDISELKATRAEAISLDLQDGYTVGDSVVVRARCESAVEPLRAVLADVERRTETEYEFDDATAGDGWQTLSISTLPAGAYRIRVEAGDAAEPISDLFAVLDPGGPRPHSRRASSSRSP